MWHEGLLRFTRIYGGALNGEQQVRLYQITKTNAHDGGITEEIQRVIKWIGANGGTGQRGEVGAADIVI